MGAIPSYARALLHRGNPLERYSYYYLRREDISLETRQLMAAMDLLPLKKADHFQLLNAMAVEGSSNSTLNNVREIVATPISEEKIGKLRNPENRRLRGAWARHALERLKLKPNMATVADSYNLNVVYAARGTRAYLDLERYKHDLRLMGGIMAWHEDEHISYDENGVNTLPSGIKPFLTEFYEVVSTLDTLHDVAVQRGIAIMGKGHPLGEAGVERAALGLTTSPQDLRSIVEAGLSVDAEKVRGFLDLVSEYNVEWAVASFDWRGPTT